MIRKAKNGDGTELRGTATASPTSAGESGRCRVASDEEGEAADCLVPGQGQHTAYPLYNRKIKRQ